MQDTERVRAEARRRRTFAIISHPDAGKTTLTEKLLLYGGAINLAGSVKQRRGSRQTTSDWMELERQRGISITTSVLQFDYAGCRMNLLDTPGHNDFSEDTYRTLAAADCAVMLLDSAKGVEPQTVRLFEACRVRRTPVLTFVNKMDRYGMEPLDVLDDIESVLGIPTSPIQWPVGSGREFQGVFDRLSSRLLRFDHADPSRQVPATALDPEDPGTRSLLGESATRQLLEDLRLLDGASPPFDRKRFLDGDLTPVFFGSALNSFGVEPFLEHLVALAPPPGPRSAGEVEVSPDDPEFSAFVFKIQANMDPQHRDRIAFARVCSGRFVRGMQVRHVRSGKPLTLNRTLQFLGQDRTLVEEAFPGDVIGIWDPGILRIGDSVCETQGWEFQGLPRFSPQHFVRVMLPDTSRRKQMKKGLEQLSEEGAVQLFFDRVAMEREPILGAVGLLQFDVVMHRLEREYGVIASFQKLPHTIGRWVEPKAGEAFDPAHFERMHRARCLVDVEGRHFVLFEAEWNFRRACEELPGWKFESAVQPGRSARARAT